MSNANLIMFCLGICALLVGAAILLTRGGSEPARVAKRIGGTMAAALGLALVVFAIGLSGGGAK